jgi:thioredoxin-related protein
VVALFPNDENEVAAFLGNTRSMFTTYSHFDLGELRIAATPTLLMLDRNGHLMNFWMGYLTPQAESAVEASVLGS